MDRYRRLRRHLIEQLGKPRVFWPAMLGGVVLSQGPSDPWPNVWVWMAAFLLVGPVLAVAMWCWQARSGLRRSPC